MFFGRKAPNFLMTKKFLLTASTHIQMWRHAKFEVSTLNGLAHSARTNMKKKQILAWFLGAKRPVLKLQKNHSLRHQPTYKCDISAKFEVSTLNGLAYSLRTNLKKRILACFLRAKRLIFKLRKITLYSINPDTNVTYMQNLRFLHWTVWRIACGQTWKNGIWHFFVRQAPNF